MIPWDFVDLIDRDPARRVKLKIEQDRLAKMHPSDLADILEDLAPAERQAIFTSLDEEVAAEALEEIEPRMQKSLTESLDSEQVAGIVEEMDPAAAADFLSELPDERSEAILEEMDPEERQDVEDLLEFSGQHGRGRDDEGLHLAGADARRWKRRLSALRDFEGDLETLTHVFLVDEQEVLRGVVPLVKVLLAPREMELSAVGRRSHRFVRRSCERKEGGGAVRQVQPARAAGCGRGEEACRRDLRGTGDRAVADEWLR